MRLVFAGTPSRRAARRCDALLASRHEVVAVVTRPDAPRRPRPARCAARRWPSWADERGIEVLDAGPAARAGVPGPRWRALAPDCVPGRRLRRAGAAGRAGHPAARLGQPALLAAAGLARRGAGAARDAARRRGHRRQRRSCSRRAWTPARCSAWSPSRSGPRDTAGDLLDRLAAAAPACWSPRSTGSRTARVARRAAARRRASRLAPKITVEDAAGRLDGAGASRSTGGSAACTPAPGRLDRRSAASGSSSARCCRCRTGRRSAPGELLVEKRRVLVGTGDRRRSAGRGAARRASGRCRPPTGPAACASRRLGERGRRMPGEPRPDVRGPRPDGAGRPATASTAPRATRPGGPPTTLLRAVAQRDAYANLVLPALLRERGLTGRDAAFATELAYGTLRAAGHARRDPGRAAPTGRSTRSTRRCATCCGSARTSCCAPGCPPHAAVGDHRRPGPAGRGRAGRLRQRGAAPGRPRQDLDALGRPSVAPAATRLGRLALRHATRAGSSAAFADALGGDLARDRGGAGGRRRAGRRCTWCARPGRIDRRPAGRGGRRRRRARGRRTRSGCAGGDPGDAGRGPRRAGRRPGRGQPAGRARARRGARSTARTRRWLDLCAGPGGKAALLGRAGRARGAPRLARRSSVAPHRARAGRAAHGRRCRRAVVPTWRADGTAPALAPPAAFDRVLVDAPCTGLGALRRRPEARWRRSRPTWPR